MLKIADKIYLGKALPATGGSGSGVSFSDIIIKSLTIPTASAAEVGNIRMYDGETNANYTHGYIYECSADNVYSGSITFDPATISVSSSDFAAFIKASESHFSDPEAITHGTMTYHSGGDLWTWVGLDASNNEVGRRQIYQSDFEDFGFTFTGTFADEEVVDFTCTIEVTSASYAWTRIDVQPAGGASTINKTWFKGNIGDTLDISSVTGNIQNVYKNGMLLEEGFTDTTQYVYTGGSATKYLTLSNTMPLNTANEWEIRGKIKFKSSSSSNSILLGTSTVDYATPILSIKSSQQTFTYSITGTSWARYFGTSLSISDNNIVTFKVGFNSRYYYLWFKNLTNDNISEDKLIAPTEKVYCGAPFMLLNQAFSPSDFYDNSDLYMEDFKIIVDGNTLFDGAKAALGTDYTNTNCTYTTYQIPSDPQNYNLSAGTITFATPLVNTDKVCVESN